jgi:ferredoxin
VVDRDLCPAHASLRRRGAGGVLVSKKGELTILQPVELAVKYCPTHALSIEED